MVTRLLRVAKFKGAWVGVGLAGLVGAIDLAAANPMPVTPQGLPVTVIPTAPEPGLPTFQYPTGTPGGGGGGGGGGSGGGNFNYNACPSCDPLQTMTAQSWGQGAAAAATAVGINPAALASTCVMESGCQNSGPPANCPSCTASGAFQMINSTYTADIQQAVSSGDAGSYQIDTSLAGKMNPVNEAYAASEELYNAATSLQDVGIADPTVLDTRAIYQWGAGAGPDVAQANNSELMSKYVSAQALAENGLTSSSTVGQWRQTIINKLGSAASQPVLSSGG